MSQTTTLLLAVVLGYLMGAGLRAPFRAVQRWRWRRARRVHGPELYELPPPKRRGHDPGHPLNCPRCNPWAVRSPTWRTKVRRLAVRALDWAAGEVTP